MPSVTMNEGFCSDTKTPLMRPATVTATRAAIAPNNAEVGAKKTIAEIDMATSEPTASEAAANDHQGLAKGDEPKCRGAGGNNHQIRWPHEHAARNDGGNDENRNQ